MFQESVFLKTKNGFETLYNSYPLQDNYAVGFIKTFSVKKILEEQKNDKETQTSINNIFYHIVFKDSVIEDYSAIQYFTLLLD